MFLALLAVQRAEASHNGYTTHDAGAAIYQVMAANTNECNVHGYCKVSQLTCCQVSQRLLLLLGCSFCLADLPTPWRHT